MECYTTHIGGWGKIFLCCTLLLPPLSFCSVCLSFFVLNSRFGWMFDSTRRSRGMAIRPTNKGIKNKIDRQTEQKHKGGSNIVQHRNIFPSRFILSGVLFLSTQVILKNSLWPYSTREGSKVYKFCLKTFKFCLNVILFF